MGALILPSAGNIFVDANTLIYTVQRHPTYYPLLEPFWDAVDRDARDVFGSELLIIETLTGPLKSNDAALQTALERALFSSQIELLPISRHVLREATRLRATVPSLKTPDAIHASTALLHGSALFVTNDQAFRRIPGLSVAILDDILTSP